MRIVLLILVAWLLQAAQPVLTTRVEGRSVDLATQLTCEGRSGLVSSVADLCQPLGQVHADTGDNDGCHSNCCGLPSGGAPKAPCMAASACSPAEFARPLSVIARRPDRPRW